MPDRIAAAAQKATSIGPGLSPAQDMGDTAVRSIVELVKGALGLGDPTAAPNVVGQLGPLLAGVGGLPHGLNPQAIRELLVREGITTAEEPTLHAIGKPVSELLSTTLTPAKGSGLPSRIRLENWNAPKDELTFRGVTSKAPKFAASPTDVDQLLAGGALDLEQPPARDVADIRRKLARAMDSTDYRDDAVRRYAANPRHYPSRDK